MEDAKLLYASSLKNSRAVFRVKTFYPKMAVIFAEPATFPSAVVLKLSIDLNLRDDMLVCFVSCETKRLVLIKKIFAICE
jgi:hypothetical protein